MHLMPAGAAPPGPERRHCTKRAAGQHTPGGGRAPCSGGAALLIGCMQRLHIFFLTSKALAAIEVHIRLIMHECTAILPSFQCPAASRPAGGRRRESPAATMARGCQPPGSREPVRCPAAAGQGAVQARHPPADSAGELLAAASLRPHKAFVADCWAFVSSHAVQRAVRCLAVTPHDGKLLVKGHMKDYQNAFCAQGTTQLAKQIAHNETLSQSHPLPGGGRHAAP